MNLKIYGSALVALTLGFMASCSSDVDQPGHDNNDNTLKLAAEPTIKVWSGHEYFSRADGDVETTPVVNKKYLTDEVEVNLAINDVHFADGAQKYDVADLCSKLSIHLRSAQDVKVTIPVPASVYCDQDDLIILNDHANYVYGSSELTSKINGHDVTLKINYTGDDIQISTTGMTEEVLNYCKTTYGDGLNFEIYNYFNRANMPLTDAVTGDVVGGPVTLTGNEWGVTELKTALDKSTIEFLNGTTPDYYINAFTGHTTVGEGVDLQYIDCYVKPVDATVFDTPYYDYHFNGFDKNVIYKNTEVEIEVEEGEEAPEYVLATEDIFGVNKATVESRPTVPDHNENAVDGGDDNNKGTGSEGQEGSEGEETVEE